MKNNIEAIQISNLCQAVQDKDFMTVQSILTQATERRIRYDVDTIGTILHAAISEQADAAIKAILHYLSQCHGGNNFARCVFRIKNAGNQTPLTAATAASYWKIAKQLITFIGNLLDDEDTIGYEQALYHAAKASQSALVQLLFFYNAPPQYTQLHAAEINDTVIQHLVSIMLAERQLFTLLQQMGRIRTLESGFTHLEKLESMLHSRLIRMSHLNEWPRKPAEIILSLYDHGKSLGPIEKFFLKKIMLLFIRNSENLSQLIGSDDTLITKAITSQHWFYLQALCRCSEIKLEERQQLLKKINLIMTRLMSQQDFVAHFSFDVLTLTDGFLPPFISVDQNREAVVFYYLEQLASSSDEMLVQQITYQLNASVSANITNSEGQTPLAILANWSPTVPAADASQRDIIVRKLISLFIEKGASVSALYAPSILDNPIQVAIKNEHWRYLHALYDCDVMSYREKRELFKAIHLALLALNRFPTKAEALEGMYFPEYVLSRGIADSRAHDFTWFDILEAGSPFHPISGTWRSGCWHITCPAGRNRRDLNQLFLSQLKWGVMKASDALIVTDASSANQFCRNTLHQFLLAYIAENKDITLFISYLTVLNRLNCYAEIDANLNDNMDNEIWKKFLRFIAADGFRCFFLLTTCPTYFIQRDDYKILSKCKAGVWQWLDQLDPCSRETLQLLQDANNPEHLLGQLFYYNPNKPFLPPPQPVNYQRQIQSKIERVEANLAQLNMNPI